MSSFELATDQVTAYVAQQAREDLASNASPGATVGALLGVRVAGRGGLVYTVIWRGPYLKGPADAPLMMGEKVYLVDS
ncbi:hypothetical protein ACI2L1_42990 [Streptomyces sp. NPDC019531]|uniref:hypothetical protein n=1 Tax=Streptomyces sp. NPDC019531 TaxID=3365062 RepID=UPI00384F8C10